MSLDLLAPEAHRWLTGPVPDGTRVVVAGVAGGVGTTTVAALVGRMLDGRCALLDHSGGRLHARAGSTSSRGPVVVHDLGPHALAGESPALEDPGAVIVLVCASHTAGLAAAVRAFETLEPRSPGLHGRALIVPVAVSGPGLGARELTGPVPVLGLPRSRALAAGGVLPPLDRDLRATRAAGVIGAEVVRRARWVATVG
ncbi:hypothetical protein [Cellulomonas sp.]|uniref:hypothetical protein n=1 Tax=Cellulomonas sp. TaxID=40001 RepID=UPI003BACABDA